MSEFSTDPQTIVDFWREAGQARWFEEDRDFDEAIGHRFGDLYERAADGEFDAWAQTATGALALVILLDQFPRNMFRGTKKAFATDDKAKAIALDALARGDHLTVAEDVNAFLAMPLMHSENLEDQEACVEWMARIGDAANNEAAVEHRDTIARFGRFPYRNRALGRETSEAEARYLRERAEPEA